MSLNKTILICLLLLGLSSPLAAETIYGENYQIVTPSRFDDYLKPVKNFMTKAERTYVSFYQNMGLERQHFNAVTVQAFPDGASFHAKRKELGFTKSFVPAAFYWPHQKTAYVYNHGDVRLTLSSLLHELSHHYIREFVPKGIWLSPCLNEGLAELVDSSPMQGTGIRLSPQAHFSWGKMVRAQANRGTMVPFTQMLSLSLGQFQSLSAKTQGYPYAQCWAMSHFMLNKDGGKWRPVLQALVTQVKNPKELEQVIQKNLPHDVSPQAFMNAWQDFAKNPD